MPITCPPRNPVGSRKEFKTLCITTLRRSTFRMTDEAIRHLRLTMALTDETKDHLPEAFDVIFAALAKKNTRRIGLDDVKEWLVPEESRGAPKGVTTDGCDVIESGVEPMHAVRRVLDRSRIDGATYFLVDWEPTWEPRTNLPETLIARFQRERRALVRRTYIEDEAVEDNSLNMIQ